MDPNAIAPEDRIQKTWIPEGTEEYKEFKLITQENQFLASILKEKFRLGDGDLVLDVGGREGDISFAIQKPEFVHIVDPDPTLTINPKPGRFWNTKIQHTDLSKFKYKLIICSHVLGYLGNQRVQREVVEQLITLFDKNGVLVLFYNTNVGYMGDLLNFSKEQLTNGHYDYFEVDILGAYMAPQYKIIHQDVSFELDYSSYEELARCCWFLFGAMDQDIERVANKFLPKLKKDLPRPTFTIDERITFLERLT